MILKIDSESDPGQSSLDNHKPASLHAVLMGHIGSML